jgi:hypothetical protein
LIKEILPVVISGKKAAGLLIGFFALLVKAIFIPVFSSSSPRKHGMPF